VSSGAAELAALLLAEVPGTEALAVHAGGGAQHAREQGLLRHFEREDGDRFFQLERDVLGDVERERGLAHGGPGGHDAEVAGVQAAGHFIELGEAGADALDALAGVEEGIDAAFVAIENLRRGHQAALHAGFAEFEQGLLGAGQDRVGLLFPQQAAVHHVLRSEDDAPQNGLVLDDADVAVEVGDVGQAVVERHEVAEAVAGFELVELHQLVGDGDTVDAFPALLEFAHAAEDAAVLLEAEIVGL
jgi:hypothetical protein